MINQFEAFREALEGKKKIFMFDWNKNSFGGRFLFLFFQIVHSFLKILIVRAVIYFYGFKVDWKAL